jgi:FKBP-type peptidyl-prolyl cis-trans isomerase FkpA
MDGVGRMESAKMRKYVLLAAIVGLATTAGFAQRAASKTARPAAGGPTKVTGNPTKTDSGLEYWDINVGSGAMAIAGRTVKVHYTGWLTTGKKFDTSVGTGKPFKFNLGAGEVIRGWDEGVAGMKVGGKRQLRIPPELGYGDQGSPGAIPPGATLIFDVLLVAVE